jgi:hypothetical protein
MNKKVKINIIQDILKAKDNNASKKVEENNT